MTTAKEIRIHDGVVSQDGDLRVTLTAFDRARVWDRSGDVHKTPVYEVSTTVRNDSVSAIEIVPAGNL